MHSFPDLIAEYNPGKPHLGDCRWAMGFATSHSHKQDPLPSNEIGRIAQQDRKGGRNEGIPLRPLFISI